MTLISQEQADLYMEKHKNDCEMLLATITSGQEHIDCYQSLIHEEQVALRGFWKSVVGKTMNIILFNAMLSQFVGTFTSKLYYSNKTMFDTVELDQEELMNAILERNIFE